MPLLPIEAIQLIENTDFESECVIFGYVHQVEIIKGVYRFMLPGHGQYITGQMNREAAQCIIVQILSGCMTQRDSLLSTERHAQFVSRIKELAHRFGTRKLVCVASTMAG
jgi:hypothetical protein